MARQAAAVSVALCAAAVVGLAHAGFPWPLKLLVWGSGLHYSFLLLCYLSRPPAEAAAAVARARSPPTSPSAGNRLPFISVVVPCKNEAGVLHRPLTSLLDQTYPPHLFEVVAVDDHSGDATGEALRQQQAHAPQHLKVVTRQTYGGGKAGAMNAAFQVLHPKTQVVGYVDADSFVPPDTLRRVGEAFRSMPGVAAVQVCRTVAPKLATTALAALQVFEFWTDCFVQELRRGGGGVNELRGNGMFVELYRLNQLGQWNEHTLTEDLDLSVRLHAAGHRVAFLYDVEPVLDEPVAEVSQLWRQRLRWQIGAYQRFLDHWRALAALPLRRRLDAVVFFVNEFFLALMVVFDLAVCLLTLRPSVLGPLCAVNAGFLAGCVALVYRRAAYARVPRQWLYAALTPLYLSHFLSVTAWAAIRAALGRAAPRYDKAEHGGRPVAPAARDLWSGTGLMFLFAGLALGNSLVGLIH